MHPIDDKEQDQHFHRRFEIDPGPTFRSARAGPSQQRRAVPAANTPLRGAPCMQPIQYKKGNAARGPRNRNRSATPEDQGSHQARDRPSASPQLKATKTPSTACYRPILGIRRSDRSNAAHPCYNLLDRRSHERRSCCADRRFNRQSLDNVECAHVHAKMQHASPTQRATLHRWNMEMDCGCYCTHGGCTPGSSSPR